MDTRMIVEKAFSCEEARLYSTPAAVPPLRQSQLVYSRPQTVGLKVNTI